MIHRYREVDRGEEHVHRWLATCTCGRWNGTPRRRRRDAEKQYRAHVNQQAKGQRARGKVLTRLPHFQPLTPADLLPEGLR